MRRETSGKSRRIALSAVLAACSLVFLYLTSYLPSGKLGMTAAAGLFPAAAVSSCGFGAGVLCYFGTGILALLLLPDKNVVILYLLFFGFYPILKGWIEKLQRLPLEIVLKVLIFNVYVVILASFFYGFFIGVLPEISLSKTAAIILANIVFLLYDYGFSKVITFYRLRIEQNVI